MTVYKYLGYGVTNENGIAKLDHDAEGQEISHSYVGVGAGEIDVVASLDNPVESGSIVSATYTVTDCIWLDSATSLDSNKWQDRGCSTSYSNDKGTTISKNTDYRYQSKYTYTDDLATMFDIYVPSTASANPTLYCWGQDLPVQSSDFSRNNWHNCKIERRNQSIKVYVDDVFLYEVTPSSMDSTFQFRVNNIGAELSFKNFGIYPI